MMNTEYAVRRLPETMGAMRMPAVFDPAALPAPYDALEEAALNQFPWPAYAYQPRSFARVGYNDAGLHVLMYSDETPLRAEVLTQGGHVCDDSCLEFFLNPFPESDSRYINIEMTPLGVMLLGVGDGRHDRLCLKRPPLPGMDIQTNVRDADTHRGWWAIAYTVPMAFLRLHFPQGRLGTGSVMAANFYKCGDRTVQPHYGVWQSIGTAQPDYHQPSFFGRLRLV